MEMSQFEYIYHHIEHEMTQITDNCPFTSNTNRVSIPKTALFGDVCCQGLIAEWKLDGDGLDTSGYQDHIINPTANALVSILDKCRLKHWFYIQYKL